MTRGIVVGILALAVYVALGIGIAIVWRRWRAHTAQQRRREPRYLTDWPGRFRVASDQDWRPCRVVDVSRHGAAIEPAVVRRGEEPTGWLELELASRSGRGTAVCLSGVIQRRSRSPRGDLRLGVAFVGLSRDQEDLLEVVIRLTAS